MKELNEIKSLMKEYQEQTRGNFADVNDDIDDIDDIRGHLVNIEQLLNQIIKGKEGESNE